MSLFACYFPGLGRMMTVFLLAGLGVACPPPGSEFRFPKGYFRETDHERRFISILPGDGTNNLDIFANHNGKQWEDGLIPVCFDPTLTDAQVDNVSAYLRAAWNKWANAGIDAAFVLELDSPACKNLQGRTENYLWVQAAPNSGAGLSADMGNSAYGTTLNIDVSSDASHIGTDDYYDYTNSYAHELGHIMGLLHEQQNPGAWSTVHGGAAAFDSFIWNCQNLDDYAQCYNNVLEYYNGDAETAAAYMSQACTSSVLAAQYVCNPARGADEPPAFLMSYFYLPPVGGNQFIQYSTFDSQSTMLYPGQVGAVAEDKPVYTYSNGDTVGRQDPMLYPYYPPSALDAQGVRLFSPKPFDTTQYAPYFSAGSPMNAVWETSPAGTSCAADPFSDFERRRRLARSIPQAQNMTGRYLRRRRTVVDAV
ncbi:hypothetical protein TsFJ059_000004 [Trichoderma semiorbis]|uniref:Uncharacterized protein n=1 Tax=Trichoderma semiorbis TaxID=1491008 RepID=A0A9P8HNM0_9HYPO|nr:hypothetical protein TsFJ059_000004 [Trichoderma semiorbis]